jgi:hypothetical protein
MALRSEQRPDPPVPKRDQMSQRLLDRDRVIGGDPGCPRSSTPALTSTTGSFNSRNR